LILQKLETDDDLQLWRRFVAEYQTLKGYNEFHRQATKQRINGMQARRSGENDNNKAYKEYVKHMFPDGDPETLLAALAALKKDL
jgi:DNA-nicking Smr family endonuclease